MTLLALGLDAFGARFLRRLAADGALPNLTAAGALDSVVGVRAPVDIAPDAVWPAFATGAPIERHGRYGEWVWDPAAMDVRRTGTLPMPPFWAGAPDVSVGCLDLPTAPVATGGESFMVTGWGPHDAQDLRQSVPAAARGRIGEHPFGRTALTPRGPGDRADFEALAARCIAGVDARAQALATLVAQHPCDLLVAVFCELHHLGHLGWQEIEPQDPTYAGLPRLGDPSRSPLHAIAQGIDAAAGRLLAVLPPGSRAVAFAPHGMRPTAGQPDPLGKLLVLWGFAAAPAPSRPSSAVSSTVAALKRRAPKPVKRMWYDRVPLHVIDAVSRVNAQPQYDWGRTRAFSLASDQNGWVRVNLRGRERDGIVDPADAPALLDELEARLRVLSDPAGARLVARMARPSLANPALPDVVLAWTRAAHGGVMAVDGHPCDIAMSAPAKRGEHEDDGFLAGPAELVGAEPIDVAGLGHALLAATRRQRRDAGGT